MTCKTLNSKVTEGTLIISDIIILYASFKIPPFVYNNFKKLRPAENELNSLEPV